jgi:serine/threonine-protein kinase SRPK3
MVRIPFTHSLYFNSAAAATPDQYVAIKVLTVIQSFCISDGIIFEFDSIQLVTAKNPAHRGYKHCVTARETFTATSKHGDHLCLVTDPLGSTLASLQISQPKGVFTVPVVKRIIKQCLLALDYLHTECRLVHTGQWSTTFPSQSSPLTSTLQDLKPANILVSIGRADEEITTLLKEHPSKIYEPRTNLYISPDPIVTVKSQPLPNFGLHLCLDDLVVKLGDYGSSECSSAHSCFYHSKLIAGSCQPSL